METFSGSVKLSILRCLSLITLVERLLAGNYLCFIIIWLRLSLIQPTDKTTQFFKYYVQPVETNDVSEKSLKIGFSCGEVSRLLSLLRKPDYRNHVNVLKKLASIPTNQITCWSKSDFQMHSQNSSNNLWKSLKSYLTHNWTFDRDFYRIFQWKTFISSSSRRCNEIEGER